MSNKADAEYWNDEYLDYRFHIARHKDFIRRWIETYIPPADVSAASCLEIGCYPGRFLAVFGELGYCLSGVDLVDSLDALPRWLNQCGYQTGEFHRADFTTTDFQTTFDVVSSFGFIEHFTNWTEILEKHISLVSDQGYLVLEAPNFVGRFQNWLHSTCDKANFARHHLPAMHIEKWLEIIERSGFEIVHAGYFGKFRFWTEKEPRPFDQRVVLRALRIAQPLLRHALPANRKAYSPFGGVIARRLR